jgi:toxin ParE1/3/4
VKPAVFHHLAEAEYLAAIDYYERQRRDLGLELQAEVERAIEAIQRDPERFPLYEGENARQYILKSFPYSVIYAELEESIWIAAVAHHKRKPGYWARRQPR